MSRRDQDAGSARDRKSTRLNSSHGSISYAVFCLKQNTLTFALFIILPHDAFRTHAFDLGHKDLLDSAGGTTGRGSDPRVRAGSPVFCFFLRIRRPPSPTPFPPAAPSR